MHGGSGLKATKNRLDIALVSQGLAASREKAQALIMAGLVLVDGQRIDKASQPVAEGAHITVKGDACPYVSRGGYKLEKAIAAFGLSFQGLHGLDIGASTGGFTDCMLQNGMLSVAAVDVGYNQLDWKLRNDPRVLVLERTNARALTPELIGGQKDFASIDVSFISLSLIFPALARCLKAHAHFVALVKPQFEAGREKVGKKGVVRAPQTHREVLKAAVYHALQSGLSVIGVDFSPIKGPEGNIEFLLYGQNDGVAVSQLDEDQIADTVDQAHQALDGSPSHP